MPIQYVANDPRAKAFNKPASIQPRADRKPSQTGFTFAQLPPAQNYPPRSVEALSWQAREAALAALEMFEGLHGPVRQWARATNPKRLMVDTLAGNELNAYYDGDSLQFFQHPVGNVLVHTGASAEVVAHEVGHALLDTLRPELWDANFLEAAAFHEAFGDCVAMLTALADPAMRKAVRPLLGSRNFVETFGEELAWAAGKVHGNINASKPRQAHNKYQWNLPDVLPKSGKGGSLIAESHSFGQIFSGCFYDVITLAYAQGPKTDAGLWAAASAAAKLLFGAARSAPLTPRFFQSIGRAMVLQDRGEEGKLRSLVGKAFQQHGILLGSAAMTAPRAALAGDQFKRMTATAVELGAATTKDVRQRLSMAAGSILRTRTVQFGLQRLAEVSHARSVDLSGIADYLDGVSARGFEPMLVGAVRGTMAVMGGLPDPAATIDEVRSFVSGLVARNEIAAQRPMPAASGAIAVPAELPAVTTHRIVENSAGNPHLERRGFACGCGQRHD